MSDETTVIAEFSKPKRVRMYKEDYVSQITIMKIDLHAAQVAARNLAEENIRLRARDGRLTCAVSVLAVIATVLVFALMAVAQIGGAR